MVKITTYKPLVALNRWVKFEVDEWFFADKRRREPLALVME